MKKIFIMALTIGLLGYSASAQFHVELGPNFNSPQGDFADLYDLGIGFYIEPKYAITENIDLGLVIGSNAFAGASISTGSAGALGSVAILPTATYRFSTNDVTPYAGLAVGLHNFKGAEFTPIGGATIDGESESKFGFAPRVGIYLSRLNLGIAYNLVSDADFLQFNLGVRIGNRG